MWWCTSIRLALLLLLLCVCVVQEDDPSFVLQLIEQGVDGADVDPWALRRAAEYGLVKTTEALILLGLPPVDEDAIRCLDLTVEAGCQELAGLFAGLLACWNAVL